MVFKGNLRKMYSILNEEVSYTLPFYNLTEPNTQLELNQLIGSTIRINFSGVINCSVTGKKIRKTYGDGMSYDAFRSSPLAAILTMEEI